MKGPKHNRLGSRWEILVAWIFLLVVIVWTLS